MTVWLFTARNVTKNPRMQDAQCQRDTIAVQRDRKMVGAIVESVASDFLSALYLAMPGMFILFY